MGQVKRKEKPVESKPIKLNLGCGEHHWAGFINVDAHAEGADARFDISSVPYPYEENSVDEIQIIHVIEHLDPRAVLGIVKEWLRILKPGGMLVIECPSFEKVIGFCINPKTAMNPYLTKYALYGDVPLQKGADGAGQIHRWCYSLQELADLLAGCGFVNLEREPALFHIMGRDQRWLAYKPE